MVNLGADPDIYLARVDWFPDSAATRGPAPVARPAHARSAQGRRPHRFEHDAPFTETSHTWVDLHDELLFLARRQQFIWASNRSGYKHLYLYDYDGRWCGR